MASEPSVPPPRRAASTLLSGISRLNLALLLLLYVTSLHLIGLYTFTRGFLLTRLTIPLTSPPYTPSDPPPLAPTHQRAIFLVIDALRTDFISPYPPQPPSPNHHAVLTLPAELTASHPAHSLIFHTYSDPPTSTMQRIKGLTTGSLPTFIDVGSNFASTAIEEDSLISQLVAHNRSIAFMGDDTWMGLFPTSFEPSMAWPYDSFNVEDLHTVDNGVIEHLFPTMQAGGWDLLIGHFLGVDHVGHRVGPERDTMRDKLTQMDEVLRRVVERMGEDTLLVVLGDHGMDSKGNHGGDSEMETDAALWIYSKIPVFSPEAKQGAETYLFPGSATPLRHINQIDLVPTLAFLLGVPIPFNNLGAVIPECFPGKGKLETATRTNAEQIKRYVEAYGDGVVAHTLRQAWQTVDTSIEARSIETHRHVALAALAKLRALWAQFSLSLILLGALVLFLSITTLLAMYKGVRSGQWETYVRLSLETALPPALILAVLAGFLAVHFTRDLHLSLQALLITFAITSSVILTLPLLVNPSLPSFQSQRFLGPFLLVLHSLAFASNSFIMWEDRMVLFLLATSLLLSVIKSWTAPTAGMRLKLVLLSLAILLIARLVGTITICREEQQPYCRVTFFAGSTPSAPVYALVLVLPLAFMVIPRVIALHLSLSKSLAGPAKPALQSIRVILSLNSIYWLLERLLSSPALNPDRVSLVHTLKLVVARVSLFVLVPLLLSYLSISSLCISTSKSQDGATTEVFGFANAYGSSYLLFFLALPFALTHLVSQPTAQVTLTATLFAIMLYAELVDAQRDAVILRQSFSQSASSTAASSQAQAGGFDPSAADLSSIIVRPTFSDVVPVALLGFLAFFATGHQAVLSSIQWKAAFVGFSTVTYPYSPLLVVLNTWGPFFLSALAVPLVVLWNLSPRPSGAVPVLAHTLQMSLAMMIYHSCVLFASAVCSAVLRRHLMVWKVFAPRFMLAGVTLVVVDLGVLVGMGGVGMVTWKVWRTFRCVSA